MEAGPDPPSPRPSAGPSPRRASCCPRTPAIYAPPGWPAGARRSPTPPHLPPRPPRPGRPRGRTPWPSPPHAPRPRRPGRPRHRARGAGTPPLPQGRRPWRTGRRGLAACPPPVPRGAEGTANGSLYRFRGRRGPHPPPPPRRRRTWPAPSRPGGRVWLPGFPA